jgi:hypothetical protein
MLQWLVELLEIYGPFLAYYIVEMRVILRETRLCVHNLGKP